MNWITNYVRPKINSMLGRPDRDVPENLWIKCPETGEMVFHRDLEENKWVIPASGYHMKMPAKARLKDLFDDGATCDCNCGARDPDCGEALPVVGCELGEVCIADACAEPIDNDACADAVPLVEGTVNGTWAGTVNDLSPPTSCTGFPEVGGDVFYSVSLAAGETSVSLLHLELAKIHRQRRDQLMADCRPSLRAQPSAIFRTDKEG